MASGSLVRLVALGKENDTLNMPTKNNPVFNYFKMSYKRHINFSTTTQKQVFVGLADFGNKITCNLSKNADLITGLTLKYTLPAIYDQDIFQNQKFYFCNSISHAILDSAEIKIGAKIIEKTFGEWMEIWCELALDEGKQYGYRQMVGKCQSNVTLEENSSKEKTYYIPFNFWFCKHPGLALPLISLQHQDIQLDIQFNKLSNLIRGSDVTLFENKIHMKDVEIHADVVFLDNSERKSIASRRHVFLIEQLQLSSKNIIANSSELHMPLNFGHLCKELIWVIKPSNNKLFSTNNELDESFSKGNLSLNNHFCFDSREASYFRLQQTYQHHSRVPRQYIYCYSFAFKPEEHQPSGTCNFSRIETAVLSLSFDNIIRSNENRTCNVYATNYNIFTVEKGIGELKFRR